MKRKYVTTWTVVGALCAGIIPIALAIGMSYLNTLRNAQDDLYTTVERVAHHTDQLITRIDHGLDKASPLELNCKSQTISTLRTLVFDVPEIREALLVSPTGRIQCTSWGNVSPAQYRPPPPNVSGIRINGPVEIPLVKRPVLLLSKTRSDGSQITALLLPQLLTGIIGSNLGNNGFSGLVRETDRHMLAYVGNFSRIKSLRTERTKGNAILLVAKFADNIKRTVIAIKLQHFPDVYVFAAVTDHWMLHNWRQTAWVLILVGILIAICLVSFIILLAKQRLSLHGELQYASRHKKFTVNYLPIVDLQTQRCVGAEALIRWHHPDQGLLPPDFFIPLAERSGLIEPMTEWLMEQVVVELEDLLVQDRSLHIGINLSPCHFENDRILKSTSDIFGKSEIKPNQICYEITERSLIKDAARQPLEIIKTLRDRGSLIALDDFGTGYSSLSYLSNFPIDTLKIDRHFVAAIGTHAVTASLIIAIIDMAKRLHADVVAEGVETKAQADYLREHGVSLAQGWYYAKPTDAAGLIQFCKQ